jgi:hypothetical protein
MRSCIGAVFVVSLFLALAVEAADEVKRWAPPYKKVAGQETIGSFLEQEYGLILTPCNIGRLMNETRGVLGKNQIELSSIPGSLQELLAPMEQPVVAQRDQSLARVLAYIYERDALKTDNEVWQPSRYLLGNMIADPAAMLPQGYTTIIHVHDCSSIISMAANHTAGLSVPILQVKSALDTQFAGKQTTMIALTYGTFYSPLERLFVSSNYVDKLTANLLVWDWYTKNDRDVGKPAFYITQFKGIAVFQLAQAKRDFEGKISLSTSGNFTFLSADASVQAAVTNQSRTNLQRYSTATYADGAAVQRKPLPTLATVQGFAANTRTSLVGRYAPALVQGVPHEHSQQLAGVPRDLCADYWNAEFQGKPIGTLSVQSSPAPEQNGASDLPVVRCQFTVTLNPSDDVFTGARGNAVDLAYKLTTRKMVGNQPLTLPTETLHLGTTKSPELLPQQYNPNFQKSDFRIDQATGSTLKWTINFAVDDTGDAIDWQTNVTTRSAQLACDDPGTTFPVTVVTSLNSGDKSLRLDVSHTVYELTKFDFTKLQQCSIDAVLRFGMQRRPQTEQRFVDRPLPRVKLGFPGKPTPAATQPNPATTTQPTTPTTPPPTTTQPTTPTTPPPTTTQPTTPTTPPPTTTQPPNPTPPTTSTTPPTTPQPPPPPPPVQPLAQSGNNRP